MNTETYSNLNIKCKNLTQSIDNIIDELKTFSNQIENIQKNPTENEAIELYNNVQLTEYSIRKLYEHHTKLDKITTMLRNTYCKHNRVVDRENFDIAHTCYMCSKCGMMM